MGHSVGCESKGPFVFHFAGSSHECSKRSAGKSSAHADPLDSDSSQFCNGKGSALQAHDDVDGLGNGSTYRADGFEAREPWRIQNIRASLGKSLQAPDGCVEFWQAMKEVLGSGRQ